MYMSEVDVHMCVHVYTYLYMGVHMHMCQQNKGENK